MHSLPSTSRIIVANVTGQLGLSLIQHSGFNEALYCELIAHSHYRMAARVTFIYRCVLVDCDCEPGSKPKFACVNHERSNGEPNA